MDYRQLDATERRALHRNAYISLGTYRRDGRVVRTPVWFAEQDGCFWVFTAASAGKVKRLANDGRSNIARCDAWGRDLGPLIDTWAERVTDRETEKRAYSALRARYGWQMWLTDALSRLSGRFHQRAVLRIRPQDAERFET